MDGRPAGRPCDDSDVLHDGTHHALHQMRCCSMLVSPTAPGPQPGYGDPRRGGDGTQPLQAASVSASIDSEVEMVGVGNAGGGERNRKKTLGRRKIEIKKIASMEAMHMCFSKRRDGLYKKATELCVLTGAKVAIVVTSCSPPRPVGSPTPSATEGYRDHPTADNAFEAPLPPVAHEFVDRRRHAQSRDQVRDDLGLDGVGLRRPHLGCAGAVLGIGVRRLLLRRRQFAGVVVVVQDAP